MQGSVLCLSCQVELVSLSEIVRLYMNVSAGLVHPYEYIMSNSQLKNKDSPKRLQLLAMSSRVVILIT